MAKIDIEEDTFWNSNLETIEKEFLKKGADITDLPIHIDPVVPPQDSVLLPYAKKIDADIRALIDKIYLYFKRT